MIKEKHTCHAAFCPDEQLYAEHSYWFSFFRMFIVFYTTKILCNSIFFFFKGSLVQSVKCFAVTTSGPQCALNNACVIYSLTKCSCVFQDCGTCRRYASNRCVLPLTSHVRGQKSALCLHSIKSGEWSNVCRCVCFFGRSIHLNMIHPTTFHQLLRLECFYDDVLCDC